MTKNRWRGCHESSVSGNYSDSSKSSDEKSVVDVQVDSESDNSSDDQEPSTLPFDGSNKAWVALEESFRLCRLKNHENSKPQPEKKTFKQIEEGRTISY